MTQRAWRVLALTFKKNYYSHTTKLTVFMYRSVNFNTCIDLCTPTTVRTQNYPIIPNTSLWEISSLHPTLSPSLTTDLFVSIALSYQEYNKSHICNIVRLAPFNQHNVFEIDPSNVSIVSSFSLLSSAPLYGYASVCLSAQLLQDN